MDKSNLKEVLPMDLGRFYLTDKMGVKLSDVSVQDVFNAPFWKSYYLGDSGRFVAVDNRNGRAREYKIVQVAN